MVNTKKFSEFAPAILNGTNQLVGISDGVNAISDLPIHWTVAGRPVSPQDGFAGYNTDLSQWEFWDAGMGVWDQFATGGAGTVTQVDTGAGLTGGPITSSGTISFAPIAANSFLANSTGGSAVPIATPLSNFLLAPNNLSDVPNKPLARSNMGLAIGTNVQAWSAILDQISANTWPGTTALTTLGTITTGVWNASLITVSFGGTSASTFIPYSVICGGVIATGSLQSVASVGAVGQVLTSQGAGMLPTWSNVAGSGTVDSANINELAYYPATGNTVDGLPTANGGVLVTSNTGVPSILAGSGTTGTILRAISGAAPAWSAATYPGTTSINTILYSSAADVIGQISAVNGGVLVSDNTGVPSMLANPGATGRILQSANSAIPAWSTATYPATAGTSGNVLQSDGTNFISASSNTLANAYLCQGRATLTTAVPVTTSDVTAATTIYFTPYKGNKIALYDGVSTWNTYSFTELSIAVPSTTDTVYDMFIYDNSGTPTLELTAWTNDTTRATALAFQDGVYVKSGATTRRFVATLRTTGVSGQMEDSLVKRYCWNYNNRVARPMLRNETTASWTYSTASWRQANANSANQLDFVCGVPEDEITCTLTSCVSSSAATLRGIGASIGIDSTTTPGAQQLASRQCSSGNLSNSTAFYRGTFTGRHILTWMEYGGGGDTQTWFGENASPTFMKSGISGTIFG